MAEITIILPNFRTPELCKLSLRSLRKYTDCSRIRVIAVDNDSGDESLAYLRSLNWITLIERKTAGESGYQMHARALDLALEKVDTPLVMVMHTDTVIIRHGWLDFLLGVLNSDPGNAGVGSWKLEYVPKLKILGKKIETAVRRLLGRKINDRQHYLRSHCAIYRTDLLRRFTRGFDDGKSAGESAHWMLIEAGCKLPFVASEDLCRYIRHLNHATMILNPREGDRKTATPQARKKLAAELQAIGADRILADDSLDN